MIEQDIYQGLENSVGEKTIVFSIGHRCTSTSLIQMMNKKFETYPFDWIVSKLNVIAHCMDNDFEEFLRVENYQDMQSETFNLCNGEKKHVCWDRAVYNTYYENKNKDENPDIDSNSNTDTNGTYGLQLAMTHHDIRTEKDTQYFKRCIGRLKNILSLTQKKYYLYTHPIMDNEKYVNDMEYLQSYFESFTEYFKMRTENSFGIYLIIVNHEEKKGTIDMIASSPDYVIYTVYTNRNLIDSGAVFSGDFYTEQHDILVLLESIIV